MHVPIESSVESAAAAQEELALAQAAALEAGRQCAPQATSLVSYTSLGALLIAGTARAVLPAADTLGQCLRVVALLSDASPSAAPPQGVTVLAGKLEGVSGHLGAFRARAQSATGTQDLAPFSPHGDGHFDLILDLCAEPVLQRELLPPGYYAPGDDPDASRRALEELPGLVGELTKPQYYRYDPDLCAHGRNGITACTRCVDACPAEAIRSVGERVEVDPQLCQGGGTCATVCPSGAMSYGYPRPADTVERLRTMLRAFLARVATSPTVVFHDVTTGAQALDEARDTLPPWLLPIAVEELASVGIEIWLAGLAYGAGEVVLLTTPEIPPRSARELGRQMDYAGHLLAALGYGSQRVRQVAAGGSAQLHAALCEPHLQRRDFRPATFAPLDDKRTTLFLAIDHLYEQARRPRRLIDLPAGAPFGQAQVDERACTLCMACVGACPGKALQDGGGQPQLRFIEANCLQCGLCTRTCPENAIWLSPRMLFERQDRHAARLLKEEPIFHCIGCGKPFATRGMVERMTGRLKDHPMFQGKALSRLQMCEDCRVRAIMDDPQDSQWFSARRPS